MYLLFFKDNARGADEMQKLKLATDTQSINRNKVENQECSITTLLLSYKSYLTYISWPGWNFGADVSAITPFVFAEKEGLLSGNTSSSSSTQGLFPLT